MTNVDIVRMSAHQLMVGIPNIRKEGLPCSNERIEEPFDDRWFDKFTEEGAKLLRELCRLKSVKYISFPSPHTLELGVFDGFKIDETLPAVRRVFDAWNPSKAKEKLC